MKVDGGVRKVRLINLKSFVKNSLLNRVHDVPAMSNSE